MQPDAGYAREEAAGPVAEAAGRAGSSWLVCAFDVRDGAVAPVAEADLCTPISAGWRWIHLDRSRAETRDWLERVSGLPPLAVRALLAEETRPRADDLGEGLILNLRGVNLNPGEAPEDMIAIRMWIEPNRIVSLSKHRLLAVADLQARFESGSPPATPGAFMAGLAASIVERTEDVVDDVDDMLERLEEEAEADEGSKGRRDVKSDRRRAVAGVRRQVVPLRRYLSPQRDAIGALANLDGRICGKRDRHSLRETKDRLVRLIEDLDSIGERASILHEELSNRLAEDMSRSTYLLTSVSTIILPLTFITGLFGMNVGGIPGGEGGGHEWGFVLTTAALVGAGALFYAVFRWLRWV